MGNESSQEAVKSFENYYSTGDATSVEGDFAECLMKQISELEERKNMKIRENN